MKFLTTFVACCFVLMSISSCHSQKVVMAEKKIETPAAPAPRKAKNIILMIGDGMGLTHITSAFIMNNYHAVFEQFKIIGLHKSYSYDNLVTDSAAGATAFSCGEKTYNHAVGVDKDTLPMETILETAESKGLKTGLVTTSTIVHATPASFIAHNKYRKNYEEIASDFLKTDVDIFIGGGRKYFNRRKDDRNLIEQLEKKGYYMSDWIKEDVNQLPIKTHNKIGYLTSEDDPLPAAQGRDYLPAASTTAIDLLSKNNDKGFFLMIEGAQIDWGGHANNVDYIVTEMKDFDKSITAVLDWVKKDGNTLLIITADHESGGFCINGATLNTKIDAAFTTKDHTGTMIPVFAYGPGAEEFGGIYENTAIYDKMRKIFGW